MGDLNSSHYSSQTDQLSYSTNSSPSSPSLIPPFIPTITIDVSSLVSTQNGDYPYTAFKIYCKELRSRGFHSKNQMSRFWGQELAIVKQFYKNIAVVANDKYEQRWPHVQRQRYQQSPANRSSSSSTALFTYSINNSLPSMPEIDASELSTIPYQRTVNPLSIGNQPGLTSSNVFYNQLDLTSSNVICNQLSLTSFNLNQPILTPFNSSPNVNSNKRTRGTYAAAACDPCKKSKVRCKYSSNDPS
ncbi:35294_t:CDS:1, partial [Racocetra persica]